jgi:hypothetical protein
MLQVAGSLVTSKVRAYDPMRMMTSDGRRTTGLARAVFFANVGQLRRGYEPSWRTGSARSASS